MTILSRMSSVTADTPFLVSAGHTFSYGQLWYYSRMLADASPTATIGVQAGLSEDVVLTLAAAWLAGMTIFPLAPDLPAADRLRLARDPGYHPLDQALARLSVPDLRSLPSAPSPPRFDPADRQFYGYFLTSGTSGPSKIVPLKRRQFLTAARASAMNFKPNPGELWLLSLPLHHIGGVSIVIRSLLYGSGIYLMPRFEAPDIAGLISGRGDVRYCSLVPTMLRRILDDPSFRPHPDFRLILLGGGPMTPLLVQRALDRGISVATSFGMTETAAQIAARIYRPGEQVRELTAGRVFPPNRAEIRSENGSAVPAGEPGLLWLKGPQVFDGYHGAGELGRLHDGWFRTGDYARVEPGGGLQIQMRRSDRIVTGGENVNPVTVEQTLSEHPSVQDAAVVGVPDEEWGQCVTALIVVRKTHVFEPDTLRGFASVRLRRYEVPKRWLVVDSLPHTRSGKPDRRLIRELAVRLSRP